MTGVETTANITRAYHEWKAMGTDLAVSLEVRDDSERALQKVMTLVVYRVEDAEQHLSRFRPDSELSRLNRSAGAWKSVSPLMWTMLEAATTAYDHSDGLVNVRVLNALETWGYDRTFERVPAAQVEKPIPTVSNPVVETGGPGFELDRRAGRVRVLPGSRIDLGGIAKGRLADLIVEELRRHVPGLRRCALDMGGDLRAWSVGDPWTVDVPNAFSPERPVLCVDGADVGIATSSTLRRAWTHGGKPSHHLIDPRTGAPAKSDLVQVSAWGASGVAAEVEAKTLLLLGSELAQARYVSGDAPGLKGAVIWAREGTAQLFSGGDIYDLHIA